MLTQSVLRQHFCYDLLETGARDSARVSIFLSYGKLLSYTIKASL